jgi:hypothetical protein
VISAPFPNYEVIILSPDQDCSPEQGVLRTVVHPHGELAAHDRDGDCDSCL